MKQGYNLEKTTEAIVYICNRIGQVGKHRLNKILYYADKWHLAYAGRTVTGDSYKKLANGPAPKQTYQLIGFYPDSFSSSLIIEGRNIKAKKDFKKWELSDSDIDALEQGIEETDGLSFRALSEKSHDKSWNAVELKKEYDLEAFLLTYSEDTQEEIREYLDY